MNTKLFFSRISCLIIIVSFLHPILSIAQSPLVSNPVLLSAKADTLLLKTIEAKEHVGISAGVYADEKIIWAKGAGMANREKKVPATAKMIHRIASISKPMTAVAILQLVEKGQIDLDAPIQEYVPEFPVKPEGAITTRQLLTHTSGINHYSGSKDGFSTKPYATLLEAMNRFKDRKLVGTPGKVYTYTTYGYVVLGVIIEKVSGMEYEAYMKKHVWEPAGMLSTSVERNNKQLANKAGLYKITDKEDLKNDLNTDLSMKIPGGGIQSTTEDLLRFGKAILNNTLLKQETLDVMLVDPKIRQGGNPYAMGWFIYKDASNENGRIIGHSGSQAGTSTQLMIMLDKKVVVAVVSNTRNQWNNVFGLTDQLLDYTINIESLQNLPKEVIAMSNDDLDRFVGKYDFGQGQIMTIKRKGNQLYTNLGKYKGIKLYPEADNKLYYKNVNSTFEFELNANNEVVKTIYSQNGTLIYPKKIK